MFDGITTAPPDPIFGLMAAYREDSDPDKINLGAGIYQDERGRTPILECVKRAERRLWEVESSKSYLAIDGNPRYNRLVPQLLFGTDHRLTGRDRQATAQTPGGTGAIRVIAELLRAHRPDTTVWMPDPTWVNHPPIFAAAGLATRTFRYLDSAHWRLDFDALLADLQSLAEGDVVVLHGCCHNPSGVDPTGDQWAQLTALLQTRGAVPLIDIAYQGFGQDLERDADGLRTLSGQLDELIVCTSFSKNFALYSERVGALTVVTANSAAATAVLSQIQRAVRACYSNPPAHGAAIVATILEDDELRESWQLELSHMRDRIRAMRRAFVDGLSARGVELAPGGNDFILGQRGMFSFSGLQPEQVERLRTRHSVYIVDSGRVNFAGMTPANLDRLCDAIAQVA